MDTVTRIQNYTYFTRLLIRSPLLRYTNSCTSGGSVVTGVLTTISATRIQNNTYFTRLLIQFMLLTVQTRWSRCWSYAVWLCSLYYGALHVLKSSRALCPRVSSFLLAWWSPRLGKRELVCVLLLHLFVRFVRVSFCYFSLPLGARGWLHFVIVALPEPFY